MNYQYRDTILVVAPSAGGKTESLNIIREIVGRLGLPQEFKPHSDSHTILDRMYEDDRENHGRGHFHSWVNDKRNGHRHRDYETDKPIPFTLHGNDVAHKFIFDFFTGLRDLPCTGELRYAELSGGINTNHFEDPASGTDLSFATYNQMLRLGRFPKEGLRRVLAVIHPETDEDVRKSLNSSRGQPTPEQIDLGTASWQLDEGAMKIFGRDDFFALEQLFQELGVPHVYTLPNDGGRLLREGLEFRIPAILESLHDVWDGGEAGRGHSPEYET